MEIEKVDHDRYIMSINDKEFDALNKVILYAKLGLFVKSDPQLRQSVDDSLKKLETRLREKQHANSNVLDA